MSVWIITDMAINNNILVFWKYWIQSVVQHDIYISVLPYVGRRIFSQENSWFCNDVHFWWNMHDCILKIMSIIISNITTQRLREIILLTIFLSLLLFLINYLQTFAFFVNLLFLGHAFTIMLVYVWSRRNPFVRMNFFGLLNFQVSPTFLLSKVDCIIIYFFIIIYVRYKLVNVLTSYDYFIVLDKWFV